MAGWDVVYAVMQAAAVTALVVALARHGVGWRRASLWVSLSVVFVLFNSWLDWDGLVGLEIGTALAVLTGMTAWGLRPVTDQHVSAWLARAGLPASVAVTDRARSAPARQRRWRAGGAVVAVLPGVVIALVAYLIDRDEPLTGGWAVAATWWPQVVIGYVVGAWAAARFDGSLGRPRRALLIPREVRDYMPPTLPVTAGVAVLLTAVAVLLAWLYPTVGDADLNVAGESLAPFAGYLALGVLGVFAGAAAVAAILRRPQTGASASDMAVDDALRTSSVGGVAAAAAGVALVGLGKAATLLAVVLAPGYEIIGVIAATVGITALVAVIPVTLRYGSQYTAPSQRELAIEKLVQVPA